MTMMPSESSQALDGLLLMIGVALAIGALWWWLW